MSLNIEQNDWGFFSKYRIFGILTQRKKSTIIHLNTPPQVLIKDELLLAYFKFVAVEEHKFQF